MFSAHFFLTYWLIVVCYEDTPETLHKFTFDFIALNSDL